MIKKYLYHSSCDVIKRKKVCIIFLFISSYVDASLPSHFACEGKELKFQCDSDEIIEVNSANYGRKVSTFLDSTLFKFTVTSLLKVIVCYCLLEIELNKTSIV